MAQVLNSIHWVRCASGNVCNKRCETKSCIKKRINFLASLQNSHHAIVPGGSKQWATKMPGQHTPDYSAQPVPKKRKINIVY